MSLPVRIGFVFTIIIGMGVALVVIGLREMDDLTTRLNENNHFVFPLGRAINILQIRRENMRVAERTILSPHLSLRERQEQHDLYRKRRIDFLEALQEVDFRIVAAATLQPETQRQWEAGRATLLHWREMDERTMELLRQWEATFILNPDRFAEEVLHFRSDHHAMVTNLERMLFLEQPFGPPVSASDQECAVGRWLNHFQKSREQYLADGSDLKRPLILGDGTPGVEYAKNETVVVIMNRINKEHSDFHSAAHDLYVAIAEKANNTLSLLDSTLEFSEKITSWLDALYREGRAASDLMNMAQDLAMGELYDLSSKISSQLDNVLESNRQEAAHRTDLVIADADNHIRNIQLMLAVFLTASLGLVLYTAWAYRRYQREKQALQEEAEKAIRQIQILFDASPLACMLRDEDFSLLACNRAAVTLFGMTDQWESLEETAKLFGLTNKWEYIDRFSEFYPEYQSDGAPSREKAQQLLTQAFETGGIRFDWVYRTLGGELLPAEVTLVRVMWAGKPAMACYIRDLRQEKEKAEG